MRDFLPREVRKRDYVIGIIKQVYESYGFEPLETPAVENIDTLMGKYGEEGNQLIFKILKRGEKLVQSASFSLSERDDSTPLNELADLALRYDLTVPLARVVANNRNDLPKFFKRYQIQPVWRADRPARGRFREFYQCDVDAIGSKSLIREVELICSVTQILRQLGFEDFTIRINHRQLLSHLLYAAGVPEPKQESALVALDKLDRIGHEGVLKELNSRGVSPNASEKLLLFFESLVQSNLREILGRAVTKNWVDFQKLISEKIVESETYQSEIDGLRARVEKLKLTIPQLPPGPQEDAMKIELASVDEELNSIFKRGRYIESVHKLVGASEYLMQGGIRESEGLASMWHLLRLLKTTPAVETTVYDPSLARGLSYYTGTIMEIDIPGFAGSLGGGGRYDGLIGMFGKEQIPACGFSLGLERILVVMDERGMFPPEIAESAPADVLVTIWSDETAAESLKLAQELRSSGLRVTLYPEPDKLGKQIKYADSIKVPFVAVLGESEIANATVAIKNMKTGDQQTAPRSEAGSLIA